MFAPLLGTVRADIDRQVGWAQGEVRRQVRFAAISGALAGVAALAALGALVVGLIALHQWLETRVGAFASLGIIGGGLLALAAVLLVAVLLLRRPKPAARPALQIARPAMLFGAVGPARASRAIAGGEESLRLATSALQDGSRSQLLGALVLIAVVGMIAGRRLRGARPSGT
jgi:hypothetical protein